MGKNGEEECIDEEIFEITYNWEWCSLGDLFYCTSGLSYKKNMLSDESENMVRILRGGNINNEKYEFKEDDLFISSEYVKEELYLTKNTLITPAVSSLEQTGKIARIDRNFDDVVAGGFVLRLHPIWLDDTFSKFYLSILSSEFHRNNCRSITRKSGQAFYNLSRQKLLNLPIVIPPLEEQKRIVIKLKELLPHIEQYNIIEEELDKLNDEFLNKIKDSILQEAIQGNLVPQDPNDEPASVLLERIKEEKERLIKEKKIKRNKNESFIFKENNHFYEKVGKNEPICIDDEIPFNIPNSWQWCRLGDLVYNFGQKKPDQTFSYVDVGSIDNKNLKLNDEETILTKEEAPSRARKIIKEGAVIYSTVRPYLLNMCIIDKEFSYEPIASTAFAILNPFEGLYNKYLFYYLQSPTFINYVNSVMSGVAYPAINDKKLYNSLIALPPYKEQKRIVEMIEKLTKTIFEN